MILPPSDYKHFSRAEQPQPHEGWNNSGCHGDRNIDSDLLKKRRFGNPPLHGGRGPEGRGCRGVGRGNNGFEGRYGYIHRTPLHKQKPGAKEYYRRMDENNNTNSNANDDQSNIHCDNNNHDSSSFKFHQYSWSEDNIANDQSESAAANSNNQDPDDSESFLFNLNASNYAPEIDIYGDEYEFGYLYPIICQSCCVSAYRSHSFDPQFYHWNKFQVADTSSKEKKSCISISCSTSFPIHITLMHIPGVSSPQLMTSNSSNSIASIKEFLNSKWSLSGKHYMLSLYMNTNLEDQFTLCDYGVTQNQDVIIYITVLGRGGMNPPVVYTNDTCLSTFSDRSDMNIATAKFNSSANLQEEIAYDGSSLRKDLGLADGEQYGNLTRVQY